MGYFAAYLGGKCVYYPSNATFVIEQRKGRGAFFLAAAKSTLNEAFTKFNRVRKRGTTTRLRAVHDGRFQTLLQERGR